MAHPEEKDGITQICVSDKTNCVRFVTIDELAEEIAEKIDAKKVKAPESERAASASPFNRAVVGGEDR